MFVLLFCEKCNVYKCATQIDQMTLYLKVTIALFYLQRDHKVIHHALNCEWILCTCLLAVRLSCS